MREMKDTKQWLGPIPKNWEYIPGKYVFHYRSEKGNDNPVLLAATQKNGMYPQDLLEGVVKVKENTDLQQFQTVHKNDYVISLRSFQGGFEMSDYEGVCSPAYQVFFNQKPIDHRYYKYLFKSTGFIQEMDSVTVGIREGKNIPYANFGKTFIPYPSLDEQSRIASYLDSHIAKIDDSIARYKALSDKLDEYRKAVITKAVTEGVRGKRTMKNSSEVWIGQIPSEWSVVKIKYLVSLSGERAETNDGYLSMENVESWTGKFVYTGASAEGDTLKIYPGQVIFGKLRPYLAKAYSVKQEGCCSGEFLVFNIGTINACYFRYGLTTTTFVNRVDVSTYGTKMPRANAGFITNLLFPVPPEDEQAEIVAYLDKKCSDIDSSKEKIGNVIKKLEEYKKSLIYNAVTGKIEC